jgi:hypothetical protein
MGGTLVPTEVCKAVSALLEEAERELGLTSAAGAGDAERLQAILASGDPFPRT